VCGVVGAIVHKASGEVTACVSKDVAVSAVGDVSGRSDDVVGNDVVRSRKYRR